jgi:hypothetical protein
MLERLTLRPELGAFASMLRERVERVSALDDERIARPLTIEADADAALVVVSEFVPGSRLSDLLDTAADQGAAPGVDAAFGYLLDVLPALCGLHAGAGFFHGAITPARTVLTPAGQVVLLDAIYGDALSHLRYSRRKLWTEFGIVTSDAAGPPRLGVQSDIAQVVLSAVMLVLGRPLYVDEYPDALPRLLLEVGEVAQIRGSSEFATGLQVFLHRALPLPNRHPYASADDALIDLRELATELGIHVCRRALVDFIEQMDPSGGQDSAPVAGAQDDTSFVEEVSPAPAIAKPHPGLFIDLPAEFELVDVEDEHEDDQDPDEAEDAEIHLDSLVDEDESPYDDRIAEVEIGLDRPVPDEPVSWPEHAQATGIWNRPQPDDADRPDAASATYVDGPGLPDAAGSALHTRETVDAGLSGDASPDTSTASVRSRRAKRTRSARARKDKLRSAATPAPLLTQMAEPPRPFAIAPESTPIAAPEPDREAAESRELPAHAGRIDEPAPAPPPVPDDNWLVKPGRADAFDHPAGDFFSSPPPPVAEALPVPAATPFAPGPPAAAPVAPVVSFPPPPPPLPQYPPVTVPSPAPPFSSSSPFAAQPWTPAPVVAAPPPSSGPVTTVSAAPQPLKLKEPAIRPRAARPAPPVTDIWATPAPAPAEREASGQFPWKLAAAALVAMAVLIVAGRSFQPGRSVERGNADADAATATAATAHASRDSSTRSPATAAPAAAATTPASSTGRLEIETQPAGARVLLDGKPAGESPLSLDAVAVGRHTVTLTTASGSVKRSIRIEPGRTVKLDVPIFSGWVGIFAPFVVEVAEGGRLLGTTEESRLMLGPGRHELTLTNRELGYSSVQHVEIEPGETRSITLDPRGTVNLNASPWAEVWVGGKKVGDTPLAGLQLPLGIQEIAFRHPQFGERRVTVSVKGNAPAALSVDMTRR